MYGKEIIFKEFVSPFTYIESPIITPQPEKLYYVGGIGRQGQRR